MREKLGGGGRDGVEKQGEGRGVGHYGGKGRILNIDLGLKSRPKVPG